MVNQDSEARVATRAKHLAILTTFSSGHAVADLISAYDSYEHHMGWGFGFFGGLGMLLLWVFVIATIVFAVNMPQVTLRTPTQAVQQTSSMRGLLAVRSMRRNIVVVKKLLAES